MGFGRDRFIQIRKAWIARIRREVKEHVALINEINKLKTYINGPALSFLYSLIGDLGKHTRKNTIKKEMKLINNKLDALIVAIENKPQEQLSIKEEDIKSVGRMWERLSDYFIPTINSLSRKQRNKELDKLEKHKNNMDGMIRQILIELQDYLIEYITSKAAA